MIGWLIKADKYEADGGLTLLRCKEILNKMGAVAAEKTGYLNLRRSGKIKKTIAVPLR